VVRRLGLLDRSPPSPGWADSRSNTTSSTTARNTHRQQAIEVAITVRQLPPGVGPSPHLHPQEEADWPPHPPPPRVPSESGDQPGFTGVLDRTVCSITNSASRTNRPAKALDLLGACPAGGSCDLAGQFTSPTKAVTASTPSSSKCCSRKGVEQVPALRRTGYKFLPSLHPTAVR